MTARPDAILLLGPTGSGKTPLGEHLAEKGLWGRPCAHFDFGRQLRHVVSACLPPPHFDPADLQLLRGILRRGALLENHQFHLAEKILLAFLDDKASNACPLIVLNGLPRHVDQARDVDRYVDVRAVVVLSCTSEVVLARIASDAGGDRAGRCDDAEPAVRAKLELFARRTAPLVDYYRARGAVLFTVPVALETTAESIGLLLQGAPPC